MSSLAHDLFSPLGKEYCVYFYFLTVLSFISFFIVIIHGVHSIINRKGKVFDVLVRLIAPFLLYFNNRLLYGMCVH
jgi:hypothetical protein